MDDKKKISIIFLDVDGVLNHEKFYRKTVKQERILYRDDFGEQFCPHASKWLDRLIRHTGAKVVISASMRAGGLKKMKLMWEQREMAGEVIAVSPKFYYEANIRYKNLGSVERGAEIEWWLQKYGYYHWNVKNYGKKEVRKRKEKCHIKNYVIFDDDRDMLYTQRRNFVHVNRRVGFGWKDYLKGLYILKFR